MTLRISLLVSAVWALSVVAGSQSKPEATVPSDAEIREILTQRIDAMHGSVGIVVGVIDPQGQWIVDYGHLNQDDTRPLDGNTIFEIGSVSKVFTSLLLADMVERKEVSLNDPVAKFLPDTVKVPERDGKQITLLDLATHTSGLPRMPSNFDPKDPNNPYVDYSVEQLYQFLSNYQLPRDPGAQYEYSNLGGGLLGLALARRAGMDYGTLVRRRICEPLGMEDTGIALTPELKARLAVGHDADLKPAENWDLGTAFAGAGALRSDANDMLKFVAANLGLAKSPLTPAMAAMLNVRRPTDMPGISVALGWHIFTTGGKEIIWHNGGTGGYRSFVGFDPKTRVGIVVLSNSETPEGVDDIGHHLLDVTSPLMRPPTQHKEVHVDPKIYDGYVGVYQLAAKFFITITHDGDHLYEQASGQPKIEIFPESEKEYFLKVVDAQITFVTDDKGRATALILHQNGQDVRGERVEGTTAAQAPKERKEVHVDPKIFQGYVGTYQLAPGFSITITTEGDHLYAQATGQNKFEIFPENDKEYFYKVVDAQITFITDKKDKATELILHQGGRDMPGKRAD